MDTRSLHSMETRPDSAQNGHANFFEGRHRSSAPEKRPSLSHTKWTSRTEALTGTRNIRVIQDNIYGIGLRSSAARRLPVRFGEPRREKGLEETGLDEDHAMQPVDGTPRPADVEGDIGRLAREEGLVEM